MSCKNKKCKKQSCNGCTDLSVSVPTRYSNDPGLCPKPNPCSEQFPMECICYDGPDIVELNIKSGDKLDLVLKKIIMAISNPGCSNFSDDTACQGTVGIIVSDITPTTFNLYWNSVPAATSYIIEYRVSGDIVWLTTTPVIAPTVSAMVTGVLPDTVYEVRIQTVCSGSTCYSLTIKLKTNLIS